MKLRILLLVVVSLSLTNCEKDHMFDCFKNTGVTTTEERSAAPFSEINIKDNIDVKIFPNTTPFIRVTAGENLIDGIITELSGNTLYIRNENRCNWMRSFKNTFTVEIGVDKPTFIHYEGSGDVNCMDTIHTDDFTFDCVGSSGTVNLILNCREVHLRNITNGTELKVFGFCNVNYIILTDTGVIDASGYDTDYSYVSNKSTGDCRIRVKNQLDYEIKYVGNIYYTGEPVVTSLDNSGSGKLIHY